MKNYIPRHLDLFAGIGGFSLAASLMGWETVAQVEWDAWCQKVLAKNFPDALRFGDIVEFNKMLEDGRVVTNANTTGLTDRAEQYRGESASGGEGEHSTCGCGIGIDSNGEHREIHNNRENGEITTDTNGCGYVHGKLTKQSTEGGVNALGQSDEDNTHGRINLGHIDIITGGFPCQPFSHAGKRKELETTDRKYSGTLDQFNIDNENQVLCINGKDKILLSPIINWTHSDVWRFIRDNKLKYCKLYDEGYSRIGCMFCPMAPVKMKQLDRKRYPGVEKLIKKSIQKLCDDNNYGDNMNKDVDEIFNWWVSNDSVAKFQGMKQNYKIDFKD